MSETHATFGARARRSRDSEVSVVANVPEQPRALQLDSLPPTGIAARAPDLSRDASGIWVSRQTQAISYPTSGNDDCYQVEDSSYWFRHRNECISVLVRRFPPPGPILDVGGGNGYVTRRLIDEGFATSLLEPGPRGAWNAKIRRGIPEVICATLSDAGLPAQSIGGVGCFDVVEHVEDDRSFLREVHRLLQPGGMLYLTVPAHGWLWSASDVTAGHYRRYTRTTLNELLRDNGYEPLYASYLFRVLTLPVLLLRALPFRLKRGGGGSMLSSDAEHGTNGGLTVSAIEALLRRESKLIAGGASIGVGTSLLAVARKA